MQKDAFEAAILDYKPLLAIKNSPIVGIRLFKYKFIFRCGNSPRLTNDAQPLLNTFNIIDTSDGNTIYPLLLTAPNLALH
jgi:hypothetical protein